MKNEQQSTLVYGVLRTNFGTFELIDTRANKYDIPKSLRDAGAVSFYVRNGLGYAQYVVVRGEFLIEWFPEPKERNITFVIEEVDDKNVPMLEQIIQ